MGLFSIFWQRACLGAAIHRAIVGEPASRTAMVFRLRASFQPVKFAPLSSGPLVFFSPGFILVQAFGDVFGDCRIVRRRDRGAILLPDRVAIVMHGKIIGFERLLGL
jgi:hypothetical protein